MTTARPDSQIHSHAGAGNPNPPFDNIRDWVAALDRHGLLIRIDRVDQDAFHATGLIYHATDRFSWTRAPAFLFDHVKIDGEWVRGPLLANLQSHLSAESIVWGLPTVPGEPHTNFRRAKAHMHELLERNAGHWPVIPPREVSADRAPCKQVILRGDEVNVTRFAFVQTNPADGGRYINSGSVVTCDPQAGTNLGTYRCQIKGPRKVMLNCETGQDGWRMVTAARERGESSYPVAIAVGQDPVTFMVASTKLAGFPGQKGGPLDDLALAGGLRGRPLDVVRCETSPMLVPAHAEMIIEGEVLFNEPLEDEGPFGEMFGYLGAREPDKYWMRITAVTHREKPWIQNMFTGMERGFVTAPLHAMIEAGLRKRFPYFAEYYQAHDTMGITWIAIRKAAAGQGLEIGKAVAQYDPSAKITIVVDDDIDLLNRREVLRAVAARWQPHPATHLIEKSRGLITDPSQPAPRETSKIVIDATRQWPDEGGPTVYPAGNRDLLNELAPDTSNDVVRLYGSLLDDWQTV